MTNISASLVAELRNKTGLGMMECKKALVESNGDLSKAEEILRIKSGNKVNKLSSRTAVEGLVLAKVATNQRQAVMIEINCETDFVAKEKVFVDFANDVADALLANNNINNLEQLTKELVINQLSYQESLSALISKLGENVSIRRFYHLEVEQGILASYVHFGKIGVIVHISGDDITLGKDIALHIAANKPPYLNDKEIDAEILNKERDIYAQQAQSSSKPAEIIEKIIEGKLDKYIQENTLLGQSFVKNSDISVSALLKQHHAQVFQFKLFILGDGLIKKESDFAAEVASIANK